MFRSPAPSATRPPHEAGHPPLIHADTAADPMRWVSGHRDTLMAAVTEHGAALVRGLGIDEPTSVGEILLRLGVEPMAERESFAPRRRYADGVYSSAAWPPNQPMCMHHELSYLHACPSLLVFACLSAPTAGGATAVADAAATLDALPLQVRERFAREGWILARSYGNDIGASTSEAFGTDDRDRIAAYCRANAIDFAWQSDGTLRTRQHRRAVLRHPLTGRHCWFNQVAFLNEWTLDPDIRDYLIDEYGSEGLPFTTMHGNGDTIAPETITAINAAYDGHTFGRPWQTGDVLFVDNLRTAHSREAFEGPRQVVVGMGGPPYIDDAGPATEVNAR
ncbi:TauD/TfdA family dioxygenase [Streptomyces erythrochromogenes]|uniref:TauD/TfdA family dioxygenase n=1 Tax=Streptomyces erythrochromogenes TaxID=285574 RepID=UPI00341342A8